MGRINSPGEWRATLPVPAVAFTHPGQGRLSLPNFWKGWHAEGVTGGVTSAQVVCGQQRWPAASPPDYGVLHEPHPRPAGGTLPETGRARELMCDPVGSGEASRSLGVQTL